MMILVDKETGQEYEVVDQDAKTNWIALREIIKKNPVDLSVLIGSGIDCLFWDGEDYTSICTLRDIRNVEDYGTEYRSQLDWFNHCTPRMDYWFSLLNFHDNHSDLLGKLKDAGFKIATSETYLAFKITGLQEGYCWPWECDV